MSALAKDLISRLLKLEPMERYSARETLQHPWFASWKVGEDGAPEEVRSPLIASLIRALGTRLLEEKERSVGGRPMTSDGVSVDLPDAPTDGLPRQVSTDQLSTVHEMMRGFIAARRLKRAGLVVLACGRFRLVALGWPSDGPCPNMAGCPSDAALQASDGGSDKSPGLRSIGASQAVREKHRNDATTPAFATPMTLFEPDRPPPLALGGSLGSSQHDIQSSP